VTTRLRPYRLEVDGEAFEVHLGRSQSRSAPRVWRLAGEGPLSTRRLVEDGDPVLVEVAKQLRALQRAGRVKRRPTLRARVVGWWRRLAAAVVSWWRRVVW